MTITAVEAQTTLAQIIARTEAGEEVLIGREPGDVAVKLVPLPPIRGRSARHPDWIGATMTRDAAALVQPLPPEQWGSLADR